MKITESVVIVAYILTMICIGVFTQKRAHSGEENFWVAGRRIGIGIGAVANYSMLTSASSYMGSIGLGYKFGLAYYLAYAVGVAALWQAGLYLTTSQMRQSGAQTIADVFEMRYGPTGKFLAASFTLPFIGLFLIPQFKAAGLIGSHILGIPFAAALAIMGLVVIFYASVGGMWAVTLTDLIQGGVMIIMSATLGIVAMVSFGGPGDLFAAAIKGHPDFGGINLPLTSYLGLFVAFILYLIVSPSTAMRIFSAEDARVARKQVSWANFLYQFVWIFAIFTVAGAVAADPGLKNADQALLVAAEFFLPPVLAGIMMASILAAIMSSADGSLLAVSAAISHDLYAKFFNKQATEKQTIKVGMISMWTVGILMILLTLNPLPLISVLVALINGWMASTFAFPIILGIWWRRANLPGAVAGMLAGTATFLFLYLTKIVPMVAEVVFAVPVSGIAMVIVSLLTMAPDSKYVRTMESWHEI